MTDAVYRPLTEADLDQFIANEMYAFNMLSFDRSQLTTDYINQLRGLFIADHLVAQLQCIPLRVMTGGGEANAVGFAGVATAPEARRRGYVAALLRHACDELRTKGVAFNILHPFKQSFYGRFGWAPFMERRVYRGAPELFAAFRHSTGVMERIDGRRISDLNAIYTDALCGRFGPIVRDANWWEQRVLRKRLQPLHGYIWRDADGQARSYLIYHFETGNDNIKRLICREIIARDPEARAQLFAFLANHDSQCAEVVFRAPADAPMNLLMPDPLRCEVEPHFSLRIIDVVGALEALTYPSRVAGRIAIALNDDWLPNNHGVFTLEFADGACRCICLPDGSTADLTCNIRVMTQIATRYLRPRTAAAFGLLSVKHRTALSLVDQAFAGLAPFNSDFF